MSQFNAYRIIDKKKRAKELTHDEITWFIKGVSDATIPTYQLSALLMAIFINGMSVKETATLTKAMLESGEQLKFSGKEFVDKHSTGGVGDKASFILAPIAAACGVKVPMVAGRGLGHTGGTIDKIESIEGFKTSLTLKTFTRLLNKNGLVLMGQTKKIAPADGIIYSIRDVTATIESIPLITASIMSKKLAEGCNGLVMDIKSGSGSFMGSVKNASELGHSIINTGKRFKKRVAVLISDMSQPLGNKVGNALEILESIETLQNKGPEDLTKLSIELAAHMVLIGGKAKTIREARQKCQNALSSGEAFKYFQVLIKAQGGNLEQILNPKKLKLAPQKTIIRSSKEGFVQSFENKEIGYRLVDLKGGRRERNEKIDLSVGFDFHVKIGDKVRKGSPLLTIYHHSRQKSLIQEIKKDFIESIIKVSKTKPKKPKLIQKVLT